MLSRLIDSATGIPKWLRWSGAVILALALLWAGKAIYDRNQQDIGATRQREADLTETLHRTEQGNEARDDIRNDVGTARYDQCLRTARTPANCERFLPEREAD